MSLAQAVPQDPEAGWLPTLVGALFRPRETFGAVRPGPVAPAARLTALYLALPALAAMLTDDDLWEGGKLPTVLMRGLMMWSGGTVWLLGPQAALFHGVMRVLGGSAPLSQAQRAMAPFGALLAVFGVLLSVAGISPESAPFVITWYGSLVAVSVLGTYALYCLARGAYTRSPGRAVGGVIAFQVVHSVALTLALGVLFTLVSP